ncbi:transposase family protein [Streptomyces sp. NPDC003038]|uniref:transposase family protein n=1 Tax=unclassified Streptomyces TaxID=2593676 RepID=UPI0033AD39E5
MPLAELIAVLSRTLSDTSSTSALRAGPFTFTRGREPSASCTDCGAASVRVHSRYERRISDTAVANQQSVLHLQVRRFFCGTGTCARTTQLHGRRLFRDLASGRGKVFARTTPYGCCLWPLPGRRREIGLPVTENPDVTA